MKNSFLSVANLGRPSVDTDLTAPVEGGAASHTDDTRERSLMARIRQTLTPLLIAVTAACGGQVDRDSGAQKDVAAQTATDVAVPASEEPVDGSEAIEERHFNTAFAGNSLSVQGQYPEDFVLKGYAEDPEVTQNEGEPIFKLDIAAGKFDQMQTFPPEQMETLPGKVFLTAENLKGNAIEIVTDMTSRNLQDGMIYGNQVLPTTNIEK